MLRGDRGISEIHVFQKKRKNENWSLKPKHWFPDFLVEATLIFWIQILLFRDQEYQMISKNDQEELKYFHFWYVFVWIWYKSCMKSYNKYIKPQHDHERGLNTSAHVASIWHQIWFEYDSKCRPNVATIVWFRKKWNSHSFLNSKTIELKKHEFEQNPNSVLFEFKK